MVFAVSFSQNLLLFNSYTSNVHGTTLEVKCCSQSQSKATKSNIETKKRCLRCNILYSNQHNSPVSCSFHGHTNGDRGLFSFSPPHQGIDGEWSDKSGVTVYKWNEKNNRPNTGRANWRKRWSCCAEYDENAPPCRKGWHVSYDDGYTMY
ncbi:unnamed protein product [Trifolium pratense]|uniref:Uncharacterized protein n=1 Tax=Trifolium pratense TaxID=57577 RepID=A0ACB0KM02_TRIPR|nr:unnamed protein product [Trifolium pratense]